MEWCGLFLFVIAYRYIPDTMYCSVRNLDSCLLGTRHYRSHVGSEQGQETILDQILSTTCTEVCLISHSHAASV